MSKVKLLKALSTKDEQFNNILRELLVFLFINGEFIKYLQNN